jgi:hypothetical protein
MQPIFLHKIGRHSSKPSRAYPVIRLPLKFKSLAGRTAHVYETQNNGKLAFLITIDEEVGNLVATNDVDKRLSALEYKTDNFIQFIQANTPKNYSKSKKGAPESGFEPESEPRQGSMIGRYTTRACAKTVVAQSTAY